MDSLDYIISFLIVMLGLSIYFIVLDLLVSLVTRIIIIFKRN